MKCKCFIQLGSWYKNQTLTHPTIQGYIEPLLEAVRLAQKSTLHEGLNGFLKEWLEAHNTGPGCGGQTLGVCHSGITILEWFRTKDTKSKLKQRIILLTSPWDPKNPKQHCFVALVVLKGSVRAHWSVEVISEIGPVWAEAFLPWSKWDSHGNIICSKLLQLF